MLTDKRSLGCVGDRPVNREPAGDASQDEGAATLFMLQELEKVQLLIGRLRARGLINDHDMAIVELQHEARSNRRLAKISRQRGNEDAARAWDEAAETLKGKVRAIEVVDPIVPVVHGPTPRRH